MQRKRGDKSLLLFCVHVCVHRGEALPLIFACLSVSRAVLVPPLSYMAPVYLPISLSLFSPPLSPRLPSTPSHHQYRSVSYLPLGSPEQRVN